MTTNRKTPQGGTTRAPSRYLRHAAWIGVIVLALAWMPGRASIPPLVESDYAYQLLAADRWLAGEGLTSLQPIAPGQPWTWEYDWGFLTQWPAGYSVLVAAVRWSIGLSSMEACGWINVLAVAAACVGWFAWLRRCAPGGMSGFLVAMAGAASAVSPALLINPSTDVLLVAATPVMLLCACWLSSGPKPVADQVDMGALPQTPRPYGAFFACGILSGMLCWLRYVAIFVPVAIAIGLWVELRRDRRPKTRLVPAFVCGAALPIIALLVVNAGWAASGNLQSQLNLGHSVALRWDPHLLLEAWMRWSDLGYYNHQRWTHALLAIHPLLVPMFACFPWSIGHRMRKAVSGSAYLFSLCTLVSGLALIVMATALFGDKFNYVGLDRYYLPLRPLYFAVVVTPLLAGLRPSSDDHHPRRIHYPGLLYLLGRGAAAALLVVALIWTVQQDWHRTLVRWRDAARPSTPYGAWSRCFEPHAADLYEWLRRQAAPELIVVSNFHEYVALETGLPTIPIPPDRATLDEWILRVRTARGVNRHRVLFILDSQNRWRDYWIAKPEEIIRQFSLTKSSDPPVRVAHWVYELDDSFIQSDAVH